MKIFIIFILILAVSACQQNTAITKRTGSATPVPTSSVPRNGNYNGKGVVTKINLEAVSVELNHEKIEDLMEPMIMEFYVTKKDELEKLKVGDKAEFVIEYKDGQEKITSIKKTQ